MCSAKYPKSPCAPYKTRLKKQILRDGIGDKLFHAQQLLMGQHKLLVSFWAEHDKVHCLDRG